MARGRRQDPNLPPSRQLLTQRAFRDRKAAHVRGLEESVKTLTAENEALRQRLDEQQASGGACASCRDARERRSAVAGGMARVDYQLVTLAHAMSNLHTAIGHASSELLDRGEGSSSAGRTAYEGGHAMFGSGFQAPGAGPSSGMMPDPSAWGKRPSSSSGSASRPRAPGYAELAAGPSRKRTSGDFASLLESPLAVPQSLAAAAGGSTSMDAWAHGPSYSPQVVGPSLPLASRQSAPATTSHGDPYSRPGSSNGVSAAAPNASVQQLLALMRARGELPRDTSADGEHGQQLGPSNVQRPRTASSTSERPAMSGRPSDETSASNGTSQADSPADAPLLSLAVPPQPPPPLLDNNHVAGFHQPTVATELAGCTADVGSCCWGMLNCKDGTILL